MKTINNYIYDSNYIGKGTFSKVYIGYKKILIINMLLKKSIKSQIRNILNMLI